MLVDTDKITHRVISPFCAVFAINVSCNYCYMNKVAQSLSIKMSSPSKSTDLSVSEGFLKLEKDLNKSLKEEVNFSSPVEYVYHPLDYASEPHEEFVKRYCKSPKKVLFLGINPGPYGMCQTGIPFGDVGSVKKWLKKDHQVVRKPENECKYRKVEGFDCETKEISGRRMWKLFKLICGTSETETFFKSAFIYNYCPIAMMEEGGKNVTPDKIEANAKKQLEELCDKTLYEVIQLLQVKIVVGVGKYPKKRALHILKKSNPLKTKVVYLLHPSNSVPNNKDWVKKAQRQLNELELIPYLVELTEIENKFMNEAFNIASKASESQEVPVGCIFVHNGEIVASCYNTVNTTRQWTRHAELNCIDEVRKNCKLENSDVLTLSGVEVYVTVEPCSMCAAALFDLNVKCIVYGCKFGGEPVFNVASVLKRVTRCIGGFKADEAMSLLKKYKKSNNKKKKYKKTNPSSPS